MIRVIFMFFILIVLVGAIGAGCIASENVDDDIV